MATAGVAFVAIAGGSVAVLRCRDRPAVLLVYIYVIVVVGDRWAVAWRSTSDARRWRCGDPGDSGLAIDGGDAGAGDHLTKF